ncbi:hypothetical protein DMA12_47445 [Amycolatopsis balhimycina DSM 5908]|uniref:Uncharacterized protein n=1 Tax=Amycolatopsis balhimycina DSM 5908 TaxID=1081091 RepID=A0A428VV11_AMYBA|nr:hypothetical protein [Amycolatopsis balhimycina]RSM34657.1 hypothetical protein DMA12_47445 [Amycolatopsis balhimycina DSM 5908]
MNTFEVLQRHGTLALMRFAGTVCLFLVLHLLRIPLVVCERILAGVLVRLDRAAARQASQPPRRRVNQFFPLDFPTGQEVPR